MLLALWLPAAAGIARAQQKSGERYHDLIIEYLALQPQVEVNAIGDGPHRPEGETATLTAFLFNLRDSDVYAAIDWGGAAEREEIGYIQAGESKAVSLTIPVANIPYDKPIIAEVYNTEIHKLEETDRATLHGEKAMRVALLVEKRTWEAGNKQFGSFTRHLRASLESLHDLFAATTAPAEAGLERAPIADRFRIELVELFDGFADSMDAATQPTIFDSHPKYDVVIACDQNGALTGYWPAPSSIRWNFTAPDGDKGLTSKGAEQSLWRSLMLFRGVPDFAMYRIPAGALPGRADKAVELPEPFNGDLMSRATSPRIGALSAAIANANAGISRLGSCADPASQNGYMWRWLPGSVRVHVDDAKGRAAPGLKVRVYRSLPLSPSDGTQGVAAARQPDHSGATDDSGEMVFGGDYLGATSEAGQRSLWLLIEVEDQAGTRRFGIVSGLWLNAACAAGARDEAVWRAKLDEMQTIP